MKTLTATLFAFAMTSLPALAEGDIDKGEKVFKKCKSCHMVEAADGTVIQKGGKTGPNLWGVVGRAAGTADGFKRYGKDLVAAGEAGLVWDEESFVGWVANPKDFLRAATDNPKAKAKMTFKLKKGAEDVYAYLKSVGPAE